MLEARSKGFFVYFHSINVRGILSGASDRQSTRKVSRPLGGLMEHISHEFVPTR